MAIIQLKNDPSVRELKQFAAIWFPALLAVIGSIIYFKADRPDIALGISIPLLVVSIVGFFVPRLIRPIFVGLIYLTFPIGCIVSFFILAIVYYLVITPVGLLMRCIGHDPMQRKAQPDAKTYWKPRKSDEDISRYFRQF